MIRHTYLVVKKNFEAYNVFYSGKLLRTWLQILLSGTHYSDSFDPSWLGLNPAGSQVGGPSGQAREDGDKDNRDRSSSSDGDVIFLTKKFPEWNKGPTL